MMTIRGALVAAPRPTAALVASTAPETVDEADCSMLWIFSWSWGVLAPDWCGAEGARNFDVIVRSLSLPTGGHVACGGQSSVGLGHGPLARYGSESKGSPAQSATSRAPLFFFPASPPDRARRLGTDHEPPTGSKLNMKARGTS
jgi:hypothetical protein